MCLKVFGIFDVFSEVWWQRIAALLNAPYAAVLALDNDAIPLTATAVTQAFAQLGRHDVLTTMAPSPFGGRARGRQGWSLLRMRRGA